MRAGDLTLTCLLDVTLPYALALVMGPSFQMLQGYQPIRPRPLSWTLVQGSPFLRSFFQKLAHSEVPWGKTLINSFIYNLCWWQHMFPPEHGWKWDWKNWEDGTRGYLRAASLMVFGIQGGSLVKLNPVLMAGSSVLGPVMSCWGPWGVQWYSDPHLGMFQGAMEQQGPLVLQ